MFFGDFTNSALKAEINSIREITNDIIDTQNPSPNVKKDFTDFIMLDYIYRTADEDKNIDACILFTGDGHFSSAAKYLKMKKKKKVIVYAVRGSFSNQLKAIADEYYEISGFTKEQSVIISNLSYLREKNKTALKPVYPTFLRTVTVVAEHNNLDAQEVRTALQELIHIGVIAVEQKSFGYNKNVNTLVVDWDKAAEMGLIKKHN